MANTYTLIASSTVGSGGAATITFSSIPNTYTDLCLFLSGRSDRISNVDNVSFSINLQGINTNLSTRFLYGDGTSTASGTQVDVSAGIVPANSTTSNTFGNAQFYFSNYAGSTNKSISIDSVMENNATYSIPLLGASLWSQTTAINSITIDLQYGNFLQYSTAYLYGIKNS